MKKFSLILGMIVLSVATIAQTKGHFNMTTKTFKNNEPTGKEIVSQFHFMNDEVAFVMPDGNKKTTSIMNPETHMMTTLIDDNGKKSGTKMKMPAIMMKEGEDKDPVTITPTTETKVINGYNCKKFTMENTEYTGYIWITQDVKWNYSEFANKMGKMVSRGTKGAKLDPNMKGFPIQVYQQEKKGKNSYETTYSDIVVGNCNEDLFSTAGYDITDVSQYQK